MAWETPSRERWKMQTKERRRLMWLERHQVERGGRWTLDDSSLVYRTVKQGDWIVVATLFPEWRSVAERSLVMKPYESLTGLFLKLLRKCALIMAIAVPCDIYSSIATTITTSLVFFQAGLNWRISSPRRRWMPHARPCTQRFSVNKNYC